MHTIDLIFKCKYKFLAFVLCILFLILQYIMCALVHTGRFVSIKWIYVQYKKVKEHTKENISNSITF